MFPSLRVRWAFCCLVLFSRACFGSDWSTLESQLSEKIGAVTGPGVVALEVTNRSSVTAAEAESIRRAIVNDLASSGIRVWDPDQAAAIVKLTLSENLQEYVWVAQVQQGTNEPSVLIVSAPRPQRALATQNGFPLTFRITPLISSSEEILDVAVLDGSPPRLLALGADEATIYEQHGDRWIKGQALVIAHQTPFPRDLRGRLILRMDHLFDAYLPGLVCRSTNSSPLAMNCSGSDDPWPLQTPAFGVSGFFSPTRNFFTGALAPGVGKQKAAPAFYSAAALLRDKYALWLFAGIDHELYLLDGINQQSLPKVHWGSDLAALHTDCRPGWQVLADSTGDDSPDSLQAWEFPDREPVTVTQKLNVNGKITALWSAGDARSAIAIYRNFDNGNYDAIKIDLLCSR